MGATSRSIDLQHSYENTIKTKFMTEAPPRAHAMTVFRSTRAGYTRRVSAVVAGGAAVQACSTERRLVVQGVAVVAIVATGVGKAIELVVGGGHAGKKALPPGALCQLLDTRGRRRESLEKSAVLVSPRRSRRAELATGGWCPPETG